MPAAPTTDLVTVDAATQELGLSRRQILWRIKKGAPVERFGHKGRGGAYLISLAAFRAWMTAQDAGENRRAVAAREKFAETICLGLAENLVRQFRDCSSPHKMALGSDLLASHLQSAATVRAALRLAPAHVDLPQALDQMRRALK